MKPFFVLLIVFGISLFVLKWITKSYDFARSGRIAMFAMLLLTAAGHFMFTKGMELMLPDFLSFKTEWVYATGILEILLGLGLLFPNTRVYAGWILIGFFILILPANIKAAMENINMQNATFDGPGVGYLWYRIPLQVFFIAWVYFCSIKFF